MEKIRLKKFYIENLFGEYNYEIPINLDKRVTAIIAPNGSGKTLCLRIISAFFKQNWEMIRTIDLGKILFEFTDGFKVEIIRTDPSETDRQPATDKKILEILLHDPDRLILKHWIQKFTPDRKGFIDKFLPFLTRIGDNMWQHDNTGQIFNLNEILLNFNDSIPSNIQAKLWDDFPSEIKKYTDIIDCRLIETQRLLVIREEREERYFRSAIEKRSTLAITEKAQSLKAIISKEINAYAAFSQTLDRSFPRRVISQSDLGTESDLSAKLLALDGKRKELMSAGILDNEVEEYVALPEGAINPAVARVLKVYAEDTQRKLETLDPLLAKINLFKKLIEQRFTRKNVSIDREHGIYVRSRTGDIPLDKLSSGEQHQLVLFFELLFEIKENSLILIDEPELSLHVAWQRNFISDMMSIISLNSFDVILATHSPQLISHWEELVVELGEVFNTIDAEPDLYV